MTYLDRVLQRWRIRKANAFIRPGDQLLDIGTADGALFSLIPGLGDSVGLDPEFDMTVTPPSGVRFYRGLFPQALPGPMKFDVITMLAVLEHIPPEGQVPLALACAAHLKPGGRLIITVPSPAVDYILAVLKTFRLIDGMALEQHYGFETGRVPGIFSRDGLDMVASRRFQFGLNNLFVFQRAAR
ncbi:MAG: methyltransferase domain-containing protein [Acidobacteriota bacterium]